MAFVSTTHRNHVWNTHYHNRVRLTIGRNLYKHFTHAVSLAQPANFRNNNKSIPNKDCGLCDTMAIYGIIDILFSTTLVIACRCLLVCSFRRHIHITFNVLMSATIAVGTQHNVCVRLFLSMRRRQPKHTHSDWFQRNIFVRIHPTRL